MPRVYIQRSRFNWPGYKHVPCVFRRPFNPLSPVASLNNYFLKSQETWRLELVNAVRMNHHGLNCLLSDGIMKQFVPFSFTSSPALGAGASQLLREDLKTQ